MLELLFSFYRWGNCNLPKVTQRIFVTPECRLSLPHPVPWAAVCLKGHWLLKALGRHILFLDFYILLWGEERFLPLLKVCPMGVSRRFFTLGFSGPHFRNSPGPQQILRSSCSIAVPELKHKACKNWLCASLLVLLAWDQPWWNYLHDRIPKH